MEIFELPLPLGVFVFSIEGIIQQVIQLCLVDGMVAGGGRSRSIAAHVQGASAVDFLQD